MSVTSPTAVDTIVHGDCLERLREQPNNSVDMAFADPPFNIGFEYDQYHDDHADDDYIAWCRDWMSELHRVLKPGGAFWLAIGDEFAADLRVEAHRNIGFEPRNWIVWYYTFGQNCKRKFNRSHVHIFHFTKNGGAQHTFNAEDPKVRVPSARALVYGDRRANPTGRLPDDTWILRPQDLRDLPEAFQPMDDTWYFSRVAGTFKERQGFHGCQMPEQLLGRIVRISSNPGDLVLDPFSGSGTTLAVAKKLGRRWLGFELSDEYVRYANERVDGVAEGDELSGPSDPVSSAPTTAAGRKLKDHPLLPTFEKEDFEPELKEAASAEEAEEVDTSPAVGELASAAAEAVIAAAGGPEQPIAVRKQKSLRELQQQVIIDAFHDTHEGYSVDWLLCSPELQQAFHARCRESGMIGRAGDWNRELLKLRKAGKLTRRDEEKHGWLKKVEFTPEQRDEFAFAGEIAWAEMERKFPGWSLDALLCSPGKAYLFDRAAAKHVKGRDAAELRWAALRLRKARHALAIEAKQYHYVFENKDFARFQPWSRFRADKLDEQPGIYLLRSRSKEPVYLGETLDLGRRLAAHAAAPAPGRTVTQVGVILSEDLPSDEYRELLWVHLVGRYHPRLNIPALEVTLD